MFLVIAEKPSVAMALAKVIGAGERKEGYVKGNGYLVSWCIGHPVAKKLFYMLSVKLSAEGVERWYCCFYCKLRVLKNHREGCYGETDED